MPTPGMTETQGVSKRYKVSNSFCEFQAVTIKAAEGDLSKGTLLAINSTSKLAVLYNDGGSGGAEIARGILDHDADASSVACSASMLIRGTVIEAKLTGFDAAAAVDMKGRVVFDVTDLGLDLDYA